VFQFLEQFSHNALFTDVNMGLYCDSRHELNALIQFIPKILPLLARIDSITLDDENVMAQLAEDNFGREMLSSARFLLIRFRIF
jgi:hypothetical protein